MSVATCILDFGWTWEIFKGRTTPSHPSACTQLVTLSSAKLACSSAPSCPYQLPTAAAASQGCPELWALMRSATSCSWCWAWQTEAVCGAQNCLACAHAPVNVWNEHEQSARPQICRWLCSEARQMAFRTACRRLVGKLAKGQAVGCTGCAMQEMGRIGVARCCTALKAGDRAKSHDCVTSKRFRLEVAALSAAMPPLSSNLQPSCSPLETPFCRCARRHCRQSIERSGLVEMWALVCIGTLPCMPHAFPAAPPKTTPGLSSLINQAIRHHNCVPQDPCMLRKSKAVALVSENAGPTAPQWHTVDGDAVYGVTTPGGDGRAHCAAPVVDGIVGQVWAMAAACPLTMLLA